MCVWGGVGGEVLELVRVLLAASSPPPHFHSHVRPLSSPQQVVVVRLFFGFGVSYGLLLVTLLCCSPPVRGIREEVV